MGVDKNRLRVMILAAGYGNRLHPTTLKTPKPLLKIGKYSLIERQIIKLKAAGFSSIIINLHHLGSQISDFLDTGRKYGVEICYSYEPKILGTAGGIAQALSFFQNQPFALVNADVVSNFDFKILADLINNYSQKQFNTIVLVDNPNHHPQGDFYFDPKQNKVVSEKHLLENANLTRSLLKKTYSGFAVFNPQFFDHINRDEFCELKPILNKLANDKRLSGYYHQGIFFDCGNQERLENAKQWILNYE